MERMAFILALEQGEESMTELCRRFGISRPTGYEWRRRFEKGGPRALANLRPLAVEHRNAIAPEIADRIVALRKEHPRWGPKKLRAMLERRWPHDKPPAASTIGEVLSRRGMVTPRKRRLRAPPVAVTRLSDYAGPNAVWCVDHKGCFLLNKRESCFPFVMLDGADRYCLRLEATTSTAGREAWPHVESAFREFGLPLAIRTDGGSPFASAQSLGRLTALGVWWRKLGIRHEIIESGHPEQNGRVERFNRTLEEAIDGAPKTVAEQQRVFDAFRREYNEERPHEALDQKPPASTYETSWRQYPRAIPDPEYPLDADVRRVTDQAWVSWKGHKLPLSQALIGELVYFEEVADQVWRVRFVDLPLVQVDLRGKQPAMKAL